MKPNILIIHCHDLGDHIGCYPGSSAVTPSIDRLAAEGVIFENHFAAAPTCSPSRAAMYAGLTPVRNGLMALASGGHWELDPAVPTLPALLSAAGYATATFGSWHVHRDPRAFGIETYDGESKCEPATRNALSFLRTRTDGRPFYVFLGFQEPHRQFTSEWPAMMPAAEVKVPSYLPDRPVTREEMVRFYGDVSRVDACVGQLLAFHRDADLERDTLVVFTSDHGIGMPLAKGTLYDPGIKIPLVCRWPGRIAEGRRRHDLTSNVDLLPTILDAVGEVQRLPDNLDGLSLWPALESDEEASHEHIFAEQTWHDFYEPMRAVRTDQHKLIQNFEPGTGLQVAADILHTTTVDALRDQLVCFRRPPFELYDLQRDPVERRNLAGREETTEIERHLRDVLGARLRETNDPVLKGPVPAPVGYWEHFLAKPNGPGALPVALHKEGWLTVRWPAGATKHRCRD